MTIRRILASALATAAFAASGLGSLILLTRI